MRHRELKVGMLITGKPNNGYKITNQHAICKVLRIEGLGENICVEVVQSNEYRVVGTRWDVDYRLFVKYDGEIKQDEDRQDEIPTPFPVGSYVIGNDKNEYGCTRRGAICKVIGYKDVFYNKKLGFDSQYMNVKVVNADGRINGKIFIVRPSWFDPCDLKPYKGLFSKAYYRRLFTISDDIIKVDGVKKDSPCYTQIVNECIANGLMKKE